MANSFAHRAYHALPKTIFRKGGKAGNAIVGFANFLLRLHESEKPRAVLVGWDTLDAPTFRHEAFPSYQSGREFDRRIDGAARYPASVRQVVRVFRREGRRV